MASIPTKTIANLIEQTKANDDDYFIIGGNDAKKISFKNLEAQLNSSLEWKYLDFVKGNKAVTIPDLAKEINVVVLFNNDKDIISFVFARESILSGRFLRQGYYENQDAYGSASIECVTDSSIHLYAMYRNGVDITASTFISVRYR